MRCSLDAHGLCTVSIDEAGLRRYGPAKWWFCELLLAGADVRLVDEPVEHPIAVGVGLQPAQTPKAGRKITVLRRR